MPASKSKKIRVGLFVVGAAALAAVVLVVWGGLKWWSARDRYHVLIDGSVMGLEPGAKVLHNGIRVGTVDGMATLPDDLTQVDVTIKIKRGTPIRTDTRALLKFVGITGLKVIDLRGGSAAAPALPPGSVIATGETILDQVERQGQALLDQSEQLMGRAEQILAGTQVVVDNLAAITQPTSELVEHSKATAQNLARATAGLDAMIRENREAIRASLGSVDRAAAAAADLVADLDGVVRDNQTQLRSTIADVRQASRSFKELARELRQRPSRLLFSTAPKDRKLP